MLEFCCRHLMRRDLEIYVSHEIGYLPALISVNTLLDARLDDEPQSETGSAPRSYKGLLTTYHGIELQADSQA